MIKSTGIIRKVDELGRVVLPLETRKTFGIEGQGNVEILYDEENGHIIFKKADKNCMKCHSSENLKEIKSGFYVCGDCIEKISV